MALGEYPNLDLSGVSVFDTDIEAAIRETSVGGELAVGLPVSSREPIWDLERVIGLRHDCDEEYPDVPFITFPLGSVYHGLRRVYDKSFTTEPPLVIAELALGEDSTSVTYTMPVVTTGHRSKAIVSKADYSPKRANRGEGEEAREVRALGRTTVQSPKQGKNPFYVAGQSPTVIGLGTGGVKKAMQQGRLGSI